MNDQAIFISRNVENQSIVGDKIDSRAKLVLDVLWRVPRGLTCDTIPNPERDFGLWGKAPKLLPWPQGDHLHVVWKQGGGLHERSRPTFPFGP
jgi:hypothetical protein